MKSHFLTFRYYVMGRLATFFDTKFGVHTSKFSFTNSGYTVVKDFGTRNEPGAPRVCLVNNKEGEPVIVRQLSFQRRNLFYHLIHNEASFLQVLQRLNLSDIRIGFPRLLHFEERKNEVLLEKGYIDGVMLSNLKDEEKVFYLKQSLASLRSVSERLGDIQGAFPIRTASELFISFPRFLFTGALKHVSRLSLITWASLKFIKLHINSFPFFRNQLVMAHRDLNSSNIVILNAVPYIFDLETMVLAEPETDLAYLARLYIGELPVHAIKEIVQEFVKTETDKNHFLRITIFYTIHLLATKSAEDAYSQQAIKYLEVLRKGLLV